MGFKDVKSKVIACLKSGYFNHEVREEIDIKNLLSTGQVSKEDVATILGRSSGNDYSCSPHHFDGNIDVHVVKTKHSGQDWYVKWYFSEPDSVFISVHN